MPNTGPRLGSRRQITAFLPILLSASPRPTVVVVLPSPAGVGLKAATRMSLPAGLSFRLVLPALDVIECDFRFVVAVIFNAGSRNSQASGYFADGFQSCTLSDPDIGTHDYSPELLGRSAALLAPAGCQCSGRGICCTETISPNACASISCGRHRLPKGASMNERRRFS